ncbi:hypothetical protein, partial [Pseudomonas putida]|uniref:hypothetical protein n=1 Tax=Pseudomonas putida TaxID=303 RepID=UPI003905B0C7
IRPTPLMAMRRVRAVPLGVRVKPVAQRSVTETVLLLEVQDYSLADRKQAFLVAVFCLNIQRVVGRRASTDAAGS